MKVSSLFTILLLFSIMSSMAYGAIDVVTYTPSKDFSVTSAFSEVSVCSCSTKYDSITVSNTGTWPAIFSISTNEIKSKVTVSQASFELSPGQSQEIFLYITADCSRGTDDLRITITSNLGPVKTLEKKIIRDRCQNIEAWLGNYTKDINPCQSKTFDINVHNIGPFSDSYTITSNHDDSITYNSNAFNLDANQYAKITATAKFDCSIYGQKDIIFTIHSAKNKLTATLNAQLNIMRNYDYDLKVNNDPGNNVGVAICNRVYDTQVPITITNKGAITNEYKVSFDGPSRFVSTDLVDRTFQLKPSETKIFYVHVDSSMFRDEVKKKDLSIKVEPKYGDIVKETKVLLDFRPCYEHEVVIYDDSAVKRKALKTCANYDHTYDVDIINNGAFKEAYTLSLQGAPSGVTLSKNKVVVDAGSKQTVQLNIKGPDYNARYNINVIATLSNGLFEKDNTWIRSYDTQTCHKTIIGNTDFRANYDTAKISIPIRNAGLVENRYTVSWEGSDIIGNDDIKAALNRSQSTKVDFPLDTKNRTEGTYTGKVIVEDQSGAAYTKDASIILKDKSQIRKAFEYLAYGSVCRQVSLMQLFVIVALIILAIVFLVIGPHYPYKFWNRVKSKTSVIILLLVIFLVAAIAVVSIIGLPKSHVQVYNLTQNDTTLKYEWLENDKFVLDVSKFFYDPDNSTLRYEVSGLKHIKTVSSGGKITFYPEKGWSGTEKGTITAYDKMGGSTASPQFTFTVKDVPKKSALELYNIYCWYVNLVILLIVLLFVFVAVFVKQQRRTRK